ncbi:MAG: invasion associated locus B family protein, partial [Rhizobiaceae bacterium]|nr:invasion associated locus B family protein [Rhizobiaceae bacterium]
MGIRVLAGAAIVGALLVFSVAAAPAQEMQPESGPEASSVDTPKLGWPLVCRSLENSSEKACSMTLTLATKERKQRVLAATVLRDKRDGRPIMRLSLPHGLMLPKGVRLAVDGGPAETYPILTADKNGSYAIIVLDDKLEAALKSGKIIIVSVERFSGGEVDFKLPLDGFAEG